MFTGQIIGYVGADARANKNGKGFNFNVSTKYKNAQGAEQTLWVCCFVNYESKVVEYIKKGVQVYVCGDVFADVFKKDDGSCIPSVTLTVNRIELLGKAEKKEEATV
ncbi:single-stranded DNA-binding protein [Bacteroides sp.]|uniref:single-stranded DNA-binding protein n=1 Tax=Bacteroides sp. TaxID=29523 RepID=UPI003AAF197C